jgi:hypothetical protein
MKSFQLAMETPDLTEMNRALNNLIKINESMPGE